jgi:hypothetical protein
MIPEQFAQLWNYWMIVGKGLGFELVQGSLDLCGSQSHHTLLFRWGSRTATKPRCGASHLQGGLNAAVKIRSSRAGSGRVFPGTFKRAKGSGGATIRVGRDDWPQVFHRAVQYACDYAFDEQAKQRLKPLKLCVLASYPIVGSYRWRDNEPDVFGHFSFRLPTCLIEYQGPEVALSRDT